MKYHVLFLHGFFNSGQCEMAKALQDYLTDDLRSYDGMYAEDEVEVLCPDLPKNPYDALDIIREIVNTRGIDVIAGNSCGAMYAHIIAAEYKLPCLVSNPYYEMSEFLKERLGTREYKTERKDGCKTLVIENDLVDSFAKLEKKNLDFIVLNSLRNEGTCFQSDENQIKIISRDGCKDFPKKKKDEVAEDIVKELCVLIRN